MQFKYWIYNEILGGPGDGMQSDPLNQVSYHQYLNNKGVGAFPTYGNNPPKTGSDPLKKYVNPAKIGPKRYQKKA